MRSLRSSLLALSPRPLVALASALALGAVGAFGSLSLLDACTNEAHTEQGDVPPDAGSPTTLGTGFRVAEINTPDATQYLPNDQTNVTMTGLTFLAQDEFAETKVASSVGPMYAQDFHGPDASALPYSGIELYKATLQPASLVLAGGDVIDVTGEWQRYFCPSSLGGSTCFYQPQMYEPTITFRFDYNDPTPTVIPVSDLETMALGNQWMFMLVTVENTTGGTFNVGTTSGQCYVYLTTDQGAMGVAMDNELFPLNCTDPAYNPDGGMVHFKSVTGIVNNYGNFRIMPRSAADIVLGD